MLAYAAAENVFARYTFQGNEGEGLGNGSTSRVFAAARNGETAYNYAIKEVIFGDSEVVLGNVLSELNTLTMMRNVRNSVQYVESFALLDSNEQSDTLYIVMKRVPHPPLSKMVDAKGFYGMGWIVPNSSVIFTEDELRDLVSGILSFLVELHSRGIVHNDIKPENILAGPEFNPTVVDFGLAQSVRRTDKRVEDLSPGVEIKGTDECVEDLSPGAEIKGTAIYIAPENARMGGCLSTSKDIWALGITVLLLAKNKTPYDTWDELLVSNSANRMAPFFRRLAALKSPPVTREQLMRLSPALQKFIVACLDPNPSTRAGAEELLNHPFITQRIDHEEDQSCWLLRCLTGWCFSPKDRKYSK